LRAKTDIYTNDTRHILLIMSTISQRRGLSAEAEIKKRLVYFSTVAKPEPDIGIDFFCNLLSEDGSPSSKYFLVQVKGTRHFGDCWRRSIRKETIDVWLKQSIPVFLVVYDENSENCYWMSIQQNRRNLIEKMSTGGKTVSVTVRKSHILEKGESKNDEFVKHVKEDMISINLLLGIAEFYGDGYVKAIPAFYLPEGVVTNLKERIRMGMVYLINNYLLRKDKESAYSLCELLTKFDKSHYNHFVLFARMNRNRGNKEEACRNYDEAIEICKRDITWNLRKKTSDPTMEDVIRSIQKEKEFMSKM
jgi:hypothetical protein